MLNITGAVEPGWETSRPHLFSSFSGLLLTSYATIIWFSTLFSNMSFQFTSHATFSYALQVIRFLKFLHTVNTVHKDYFHNSIHSILCSVKSSEIAEILVALKIIKEVFFLLVTKLCSVASLWKCSSSCCNILSS